MDPSPIFRSYLLIAVVLAALTLAPTDATAEDLPRAFNGSFTETSLRVGPALSSSFDSLGHTADVGFRHSFPMYLGDTRVSYRYTGAEADGEPLQLHGAHLTLGVHPFYLAILSQGLLSHFLSSLHAELGLGGILGLLPADGGGRDLSPGLAWSVGAGFDLPITDANLGGGLWINALYRRTWNSLPVAGDHALFLGLAWRVNGALF